MANIQDSVRTYRQYEFKDVTVSGGTIDYPLSDEGLFSKVSVAREIQVWNSGGTVGLRFNDTSNDLVSIEDAETFSLYDSVSVEEVYVTTSGTSDIRVWIAGYN